MSLAAPAAHAASPWLRNLAAAQTQAKSQNQLILVDMFADWCGWCHRIEREVFPSEAFQNASKDLVLLRLDTEDRGEGTRLSRQWGVTSLPTFVMLTPDLEIVGYIQGYAPSGPFSARVTELIDTQKRFVALTSKGERATPDEKIEVARVMAERKRFGEAETILTKLIESRMSAAIANRARYQLAAMQFDQGKYDVALQGVNGLLRGQIDPKVAEDASFLRARIYVEQSNFPAAITELKDFQKKYPRSSMMPAVARVLPQLERAVASQ